jgi:signal peptidase I
VGTSRPPPRASLTMYAPRTSGHRPWLRLTAIVVGLAALAAGWFFLAPPGLGGRTSYVVTDGVSMRPHIHAGDLALVRPIGDYRVGDIVAYHSATLHVVVLHRIIAVTPSGYIFRGDANSWPDPGPVPRSALVGKLWVLAPGLGGRLRELHTPPLMAGLAALAVLLLLGGAGAERARRRRRRRPQPKWEPRTATPQSRRAAVAGSYGSALAVAVVAAVALAAVALVAWTSPTHRTAPTTVSYRQSGRFSYAASTVTGAVYTTGRATTGQPIFPRLAGPVHVRFAYALGSGPIDRLGGTAALDAVITSQNGWSRTIPVAPAAVFAGRSVTVTGILHVRQLEQLLQRVATATAVPGESFTLTLVPAIHVHGVLAGRPIHAAYAPKLPFTLTPTELAPAQAAGAPAGGAAPTAGAPAFHPAATGAFTSEASAPVRLGPGRLHLPVALLRIVATLGLAAALAAAAVAGRLLWRSREADEPTRIEARFGESIVTVVHSSLGRHADLVQVKSIEELARLAERYDSMIIHEQTSLGHAYLVADGATLYAYLLNAEGSERALRDHLTSAHAARLDAPVSLSRGFEIAS